MDEGFDVIVVGVGGMGSAACYHLARRGVRVLGLEQFDIPHNKGSSHGYSRMIRTAYYEHPDYVPLLQRSFQLWKQLEDEALVKVLHMTGGLYLGKPDGEVVAGSLASSRKHGLPYELHTRAELLNLFPQFHVPDDFVGLFEYQAGFLVPELAIGAHVDLAMRHGAMIHGNEPVIRWQSDERGATVTTPRQTYHAEKLLFCGGAWSDKLVTDLGVKLLVTRQVMGWVQPLRRDYFQLGVLPVWAIDNADGTLHYGFPLTPECPGLKIAHHAPGPATDPDTIDRTPRANDENSFRPALKRFLPDADGPLMSMRICMYTNSPDHHFILDRHPLHPRVTLACGFSGHGFKFASVIGEALADLAMHDKSDLPIEFLGLDRFK
ncbi:MAG: sarcosine oxidase [Phycisphaerales bacterium]|jgi:sarcosine oxidase|nr:sarcosine oxidase [Phycisphaerales bacterium]